METVTTTATSRLTPRALRAYEFIRGCIEATGEPPTFAEIGRQLDLRSSGSVASYVETLERAGLITRVPDVSRGIKLLRQPQELAGGLTYADLPTRREAAGRLAKREATPLDLFILRYEPQSLPEQFRKDLLLAINHARRLEK